MDALHDDPRPVVLVDAGDRVAERVQRPDQPRLGLGGAPVLVAPHDPVAGHRVDVAVASRGERPSGRDHAPRLGLPGAVRTRPSRWDPGFTVWGVPAGRVLRAELPRVSRPLDGDQRRYLRGRPAVYLKSLTLKGFKSFASSTTLQLRAGDHLHRRAQRVRQVQRRRRPGLGHGRGQRQVAARRQDGRRHLRRHVGAPAARSRRGAADHRQHRRRAADRVLRGHDQPDHVPRGRVGIRDQRHVVPAARRPGAALGLRHRPRDARHRRPGPARPDPARDAGGPARVRRGGRGRPQAPQAQGEGAPQARRLRGQPRPGSTTCSPRSAASSSRWAARPRWPAARPASRRRCATPSPGWWPTTW